MKILEQLNSFVNKNYILTLKKKVSLKALEIISNAETIAIGSGSTVNEFIKILAESKKYQLSVHQFHLKS